MGSDTLHKNIVGKHSWIANDCTLFVFTFIFWNQSCKKPLPAARSLT